MQRGGELTYLNIQVWEHITVNVIILSGVTVIFRWIRGYRLNYSSIYQVFIWLVRISSFFVNVIFIAATVIANETLKFCKKKKKVEIRHKQSIWFSQPQRRFQYEFRKTPCFSATKQNFKQLRGCLVCVFKQPFLVFKQHFTHFNTFFHPHVFL